MLGDTKIAEVQLQFGKKLKPQKICVLSTLYYFGLRTSDAAYLKTIVLFLVCTIGIALQSWRVVGNYCHQSLNCNLH